MKELINYTEICEDQALIKKAEMLREKIHSVLPEGITKYKLLGLKTKKETYDNKWKVITSRIKPEKSIVTKKSTDELSGAQIGFFQNLNNLQNLDGLKDLTPRFDIVDNQDLEGSFILLMLEVRRDSLGRTVHLKNGVVFRPYTQQEEEEYQAKQDKISAQDILGVGAIDDLLSSKFTNDF